MARVMSNILCQWEKWGRSSLFHIFISEDRKHDSIHAGMVTERSHGAGPPSDFSESAFDGGATADYGRTHLSDMNGPTPKLHVFDSVRR